MQINITGCGEPLAVIHGWGMNQHVWQTVKQALEDRYTVHWVDLPGHGCNQKVALNNLEHATDRIAECLPDDIAILGWSLGGLIAQNLALRFPHKVKQLILVATSLSFVQRDHWQHAMRPETLQGFSENLQLDFAGTLKRFLALQFMGVKGVQAEVKKLRHELLTNPPTTQALVDGLDILKTADFRKQINKVRSHWILGELDRLVPAQVKMDLLASAHNSVDIIPNAGHAPFISHPNEFVQSLLNA